MQFRGCEIAQDAIWHEIEIVFIIERRTLGGLTAKCPKITLMGNVITFLTFRGGMV